MQLLMIQPLMALILGLLVLPALAQQEANPQVQSVIRSQIEAFKVDDFEKAFSFASPSIKSVFQTADNFGMMVRRGYPMVWRPADVQFLEFGAMSGDLWQQVLIRDQEGRKHLLMYQMQIGPNGWCINGVRLGKQTDQIT
ncbi:MAG: DUF4864 domain-containing protein [Paracoccaceae bacterium]|nr:DUF4864 domain-containing protein [Paracoccaceae bacterium]